MTHGLASLGVATALVLAAPASPPAATTERIVNDSNTGLAISGIDPVAYFTDRAALAGRPEHEYRYAGVIWRFLNPGNQAAFVANPEVYLPRYGGYDPVAIGRGVAVPGNPLLWVISHQRLYLFFNGAARSRFIAEPDEAVVLADRHWLAVMAPLVP